jgi:type II secretory pathway pseudopilin PulG
VHREIRHAFTLFEVLLVIAILMMLAAFSWPLFSTAREAEELIESARRTRTLIQMCRARAMNESRRYRITFQLDGTLVVRRQRDPLYAPHEYYKFRESWATSPALLERVWVESLLPLPDGPPPIDVEDDLVEFEEFDEEFFAITDLDRDYELDFEPDGTSGSACWVLRAVDGRGIEMTLDGRLGRVTIEPVERLEADSVERPDPVDVDEDEQWEDELEVLEEREP